LITIIDTDLFHILHDNRKNKPAGNVRYKTNISFVLEP